MKGIIYMDNSATTPVNPEVAETMIPYLHDLFENPSSLYKKARERKEDITRARQQIAEIIGADPLEIYFTSGGTESDNWALISGAVSNINKGRHILVSPIEHHAVINSCKFLEKSGFEIEYLPVDKYGFVDCDYIISRIRPDTIMISVMMANNEIGVLEPIAQIGRIAREYGIVFHTDAVQAFGKLPINVKELNVDMMSVSGHKFNGPKGTGFLYIGKNINIEPYMHGGHQEHNMRAGTENVAGIMGISKAAEVAYDSMESNVRKEKKMQEYMIRRVLSEIPYSKLNGPMRERLCNNMNFSFRFVDGETLLLMLDSYGICASTGSACNSESKDASHVLQAIGLTPDYLMNSIRFSISSDNTIEEIDFVVEKLKEIVYNIRSKSTEYEEYSKLHG